MTETKNCTKCGCPCHCKWDSCENGACGCDICDCGTIAEEVPSTFFTPTNVASA